MNTIIFHFFFTCFPVVTVAFVLFLSVFTILNINNSDAIVTCVLRKTPDIVDYNENIAIRFETRTKKKSTVIERW